MDLPSPFGEGLIGHRKPLAKAAGFRPVIQGEDFFHFIDEAVPRETISKKPRRRRDDFVRDIQKSEGQSGYILYRRKGPF